MKQTCVFTFIHSERAAIVGSRSLVWNLLLLCCVTEEERTTKTFLHSPYCCFHYQHSCSENLLNALLIGHNNI